MDLCDQRQQLYLERAQRTRQFMSSAGLAAMVIVDPINIFYATGTRNMELFTARTPARYLLVVEPGPMVLYEYVGCEHLAADSAVVTEVRAAEGLCQISSGGDVIGAAQRMAAEVASVVRDHDPTIDRIAIDRFPYPVVDALRAEGFDVADADDVLLPARAVKLPIEIPFMREAMARVDVAVQQFEQAVAPGRTEAEVWAELYGALIASEGQYICTRLMQSGPRTFPYFQECGSRVLQPGDLVCLDTDAVGYEGYGVDFSRTFLCGDGDASVEQRRLYGMASEQLEHNAAMLQSGIEYAELAAGAWPVPDEFQASRYYCVGHGLGLAGEFPNIPHAVAGKPYPLDGRIEPGMVICIESYVGSASSGQGVKLEDEFLILDDGVERMSSFHFDQRLS